MESSAMQALQPLVFNFSSEVEMAKSWKMFVTRFYRYCDGFLPESASDKKKVSILLHAMGDEGEEIFNTFELNDTEKHCLDTVIKKFNEYLIPKVNITFERYQFFTRKQKPEESYDQYATVLKNLSKTCNFGVIREELVKDIFVCGLLDGGTRESLLKADNLDITKALQVCKTRKLANDQSTSLEAKVIKQEINSIRFKPVPVNTDVRTKQRTQENKEDLLSKKCKNCGYKHPYKQCFAHDKRCHRCQKLGHFAPMCRSSNAKRVYTVQGEALESEDEVEKQFVINAVHSVEAEKSWTEVLNINGVNVTFKVDTGADCSIMNWFTFKKLNTALVSNSNIIITSFTGDRVPCEGFVKLNCLFRNITHPMKFYVVRGKYLNLIGLKETKQLGLINNINVVQVEDLTGPKYAPLFDDSIGLIQSNVHIEVDPSVPPVVMPPKKIPFQLYNKLKLELDRLVELGIIEPVIKPSAWVNQIVLVTKKDGSLRICLDPRPLNIAIKRSHYPFITVQDVASRLKGATHFAKLDAKWGFWMIGLDEASTDLCTFQTPHGRYKFLRMPFGISCAPEIFHRIVTQYFERLEGVITYQDDILIWANSEDQLKLRLTEVLNRALSAGFKFNKSKCVFSSKTITFLGHRFSKHGVEILPEKIKAIQNMNKPHDKKSLQRFLGVLNYLAPFLKDFSDLVKPFRDMLRKNSDFYWDQNMDKLFQSVLKKLTSAPVLGYFDPKAKITLSVDASSTGLGAVMLQNKQPIAYASKALVGAQLNYAQIEKELLSLVFACEKFKQWFYPQKVFVETDHKPLIPLFKKPLSSVPTRLQRMFLRLQSFDLEVVYKPGKELFLADTLSRDFNDNSTDKEINLNTGQEKQINLIVSSVPITQPNWDLIRKETILDTGLQQVAAYIKTGWPKKKKEVSAELQAYFDFQTELHVIKDVIFKDHAVVIPQAIQGLFLKKLHVGHPGIVRNKARARGSLFWVRMNDDIEKYVSSCMVCKKFACNNSPSMLKCYDVPELPWSEVAADLFLFKQTNFLVIVDCLSNYIEVMEIPDQRSGTIINRFKSIFSRHGIPNVVHTDGGPCFTAQEFQGFANSWNFQHVMSSPHYSQSNGKAESAVKSVKNLLKTCEESKQDFYLALLHQRNTPRSNIHSPAEMLMSRKLRTDIPIKSSLLQPEVVVHKDRKQIIENNRIIENKSKMRRSAPTRYVEGEEVMFKKKPNEVWIPGKIDQESGEPRSYVVKDTEGNEYRRNITHLKPVNTQEHMRLLEEAEQPGSTTEQDDVPQGQESEEKSQHQESQSKDRESQFVKNLEGHKMRSGRVVKSTFKTFL